MSFIGVRDRYHLANPPITYLIAISRVIVNANAQKRTKRASAGPLPYRVWDWGFIDDRDGFRTGYERSMMDSRDGGRRCRIEGVGCVALREGNEGKTSYSLLMTDGGVVGLKRGVVRERLGRARAAFVLFPEQYLLC